MNWEQVKGNWKQLRGRVKTQWGRLTDDQLDVIDGQRDILAGKIQEAYGISKEEAESQLGKWERTLVDEKSYDTSYPEGDKTRRRAG